MNKFNNDIRNTWLNNMGWKPMLSEMGRKRHLNELASWGKTPDTLPIVHMDDWMVFGEKNWHTFDVPVMGLTSQN